MDIRFVGANPGLTITDGERRLAFASVWRADWSERGSGRAIVCWHNERTRVVATNTELGRWLAGEFTRHFPEVQGLPWPEPEITLAPVRLELDLATGMTASAGGIEVEIHDPTDRRLFTTDDFDLGGVAHSLSTVVMPCSSGSLTIAGTQIKGQVKAFLADAEVWFLK
ncbi:hypothetical protein Rhe02_61950 [Rhizocola hellebori]|uniref:Uncharacterized protein n=1 Tax=Rhizocola hellebori TaxID=1392758 RepID=A0A8J3VJM0_9ACTN|nr:hypothetical protein [Rhizocola hellebori]GIH08128.1 hypothetical protein Rhe02_61950 [Rhizocola hellebori]